MMVERRGAKFNSVRHGIFATILLKGENWGETEADYLCMVSRLRKAFRPADWFEQIQVDKLAFLYIRLARVYKADERFAPKLFKRVSEALDAKNPVLKREPVDRESEVLVLRKDPDADVLIRYESNVERQILRTFEQLERYRRLRKSAPKSPEDVGE